MRSLTCFELIHFENSSRLCFGFFVYTKASLVINCQRHSVFGLSMWSCTENLWTRYLTNRLWEFHQIYVRAVGDKVELINFEVRGQGHDETMRWCSKRHFGNYQGHGFKGHSRWRHTGWGCSVDSSDRKRLQSVSENWTKSELWLTYVESCFLKSAGLITANMRVVHCITICYRPKTVHTNGCNETLCNDRTV